MHLIKIGTTVNLEAIQAITLFSPTCQYVGRQVSGQVSTLSTKPHTRQVDLPAAAGTVGDIDGFDIPPKPDVF